MTIWKSNEEKDRKKYRNVNKFNINHISLIDF